MAKNPIKQMQFNSTTYDVQDNTLVGGSEIEIATDSNGERSINSNPKNHKHISTDTMAMLIKNNWSVKTWSGLTNFSGNYVWTDGDNIYYSAGTTHYVLNKSTSTWVSKTWSGLTDFYGSNIWTDGDNIYHSLDNTQRVLNKSTSTWSTKTWSGLTSFTGSSIWSDGKNIYYSNNTTQYKLNISTSTWSTMSWSGLTNPYGTNIWTDGHNIYHSDGTNHYELSVNSWVAKTWTGLTSFSGRDVWTDGKNVYYSSSSTQYILTRASSRWYSKTWTGLTSFTGRYIWTDGNEVYYSSGTTQYSLNKLNSLENQMQDTVKANTGANDGAEVKYTLSTIGINGLNYQLGTFQQLGVAYYMATCNQTTSAKTVTLPSYSLVTNASAIIYFTYSSTSSNTLNINSTGAKTMRINNATISSTNMLIQGIYFVRYSGTYYDCYYMSTVEKKYLHRTQLTIKENATSARYCHLILNWWSSSPSPYIYPASLMLEFGGNDTRVAEFDNDGVQFSGYFENSSTSYLPIVKFSFRQEWEYDGGDEYYVDTYCDVVYTRSTTSTTLSWGSDSFANLAGISDYVIK